MIAIKLQGGLGNQMFQYAAAKALSVKAGCVLLMDLSFLQQTAEQSIEGFTSRHYELGIFKNIAQQFISHDQRKKFTKTSLKQQGLKQLGLPYYKIYNEPSFEFNDALFLQKPPVLLDGYWQSEKYFLAEAAEIKKAFTFPALTGADENNKLLADIVNSNAVSVHIRRGDYLHPAIAAQHGVCSVAFYKSAIEYVQSISPGSVFYFFTDDAAWVQENFTGHLPGSVLVKNNTGAVSWKDMYLMSCCRHNIIANSSFSWWGAWLNGNRSKIVVAPAKWFNNANRNDKDVIPAAWIQL